MCLIIRELFLVAIYLLECCCDCVLICAFLTLTLIVLWSGGGRLRLWLHINLFFTQLPHNYRPYTQAHTHTHTHTYMYTYKHTKECFS